MAKIKTQYKCNECGGVTVKFVGKCPHCNAWNSMSEVQVQAAAVVPENKNRYQGYSVGSSMIEDLDTVSAIDYKRKTTYISELDRVLGGGLVDGGVILLGGDPGIGKSTLLLQAICNLAKDGTTLYVTGEESKEQIALRGKRLALPLKGVNVYGEIDLERIIESIEEIRPSYVIVDSIQTLYTNHLTSSPGSVTQVKDCAARLNRVAKEMGFSLILICHVTKEGELAGPRALEHIVDTVLLFEGDKNSQYRMIRAVKNRFGSVNEVGVFEMTHLGLTEVTDPAGVFVGEREDAVGSVIYLSQDGNRAILTEIQALLDKTHLPNPVRRSIGLDLNRLQMLCAIINKYISKNIYYYNVFVSLVGGLKFDDTGIDVPAFIAMLSSITGRPVERDVAAFGEIGLTGEIRSVQNAENRIKEAARMGIKKIIVPTLNADLRKRVSNEKIEIVECKNVAIIAQKLGFVAG